MTGEDGTEPIGLGIPPIPGGKGILGGGGTPAIGGAGTGGPGGIPIGAGGAGGGGLIEADIIGGALTFFTKLTG